jgi:O-antigen/teichoic acid export membrane protein
VAADVIRIVVLARFLAPVDYGLMAMVWVVIGLSQIYIDLGIGAAIIHRQDNSRDQLSSLYWLNIFMGALAWGLVYGGAGSIAAVFHDPRLVPLLRVAATAFIIVPIGSQFDILLQKELRFKALASWEIAASLSGTGVAVCLAVGGFGVWALLWSFLTTAAVKTAFLARAGFRRFPPSLHFSGKDLKGYLAFGLFQLGERSINYLAERLDQVLIGPLLGAQALGFYNFALYLTAQPLSRINPILTRVAFPVFSKVQEDPERLRRGYIRLLTLITTINAPLLLGLAAIAPWAVPLIFGAKWTESVVLVQILSIVSLSRSIGNPVGSLQLAKGRADLGFWWNLLLFLCSVPAIYFGGRTGGAIGVAVALLMLQLCLNVPAYLLLIRPLIGRCASAYIGATLRPIVIALVMGAIVLFVPALFGNVTAMVEVALQIVLGAVIYTTLLPVLNKPALCEVRAVLASGKLPVP